MLSTMKDAMQVDIVELQSATNFGRLMAVFLWIYGLMSPISGMIADRLNRKWLIVGSLFVWSFVTYLMGIAETFNQVFWLRALMGVSEALYIPAGLSLIADYHTEKSRSLAVGIHMTGLYTGQAIGGFGATVAAAFSWHTTFHWFGIIGIAYALVLVLFLKDKKEHVKTERLKPSSKNGEKAGLFKGLSLLFSNIAFWVILLALAEKEVVIFAHTKEAVKSEDGLMVLPNQTISEINIDEYDSLILPGAMDIREAIENEEVIEFIRKFENKTIGAISIAPLMLVKAGLLSGKPFMAGVNKEEIMEEGFTEQDLEKMVGWDANLESPVKEGYIITDNIITSISYNFVKWGLAFGRMIGIDIPPETFGI